MATISNNDIARSIYFGSKDKAGAELQAYYKNVVQFLFRKKLLSKSKEILLILRKIINKEEGIIDAKVLSVEKLYHETKEDLVHLLKKRYHAREVILKEKYDQVLLGGMRIEVNDEVIDLTIKNKLGQLQEYLISKV